MGVKPQLHSVQPWLVNECNGDVSPVGVASLLVLDSRDAGSDALLNVALLAQSSVWDIECDLVRVAVFAWRKAEDGRQWILGAIAVYFLVFWVFMHT
jgi:hypothetical protein